MPGFFGVVSKKEIDFKKVVVRKSIVSETKDEEFIFNNNAFIKRFVIKKFLDDKILIDDPDIFVITDGVIFNLKELKNKMGVSSNKEVFMKGLRQYGIDFIKLCILPRPFRLSLFYRPLHHFIKLCILPRRIDSIGDLYL